MRLENSEKEARAMKVSADALRRYLAEELSAAGLTEEKIHDILGRVFPERHEPLRKRAKLVLAEKLPDSIVEEYRRELWLRAEERKLLRRERELTMKTIYVGGVRILGFVRQGEEATLWDLRKTERKRAPSTRRLIAQKLPRVRVRTVDVRMVIVARPNEDEKVLTFPARSSGVTLTPDLLRERPSVAMLRVYRKDGEVEECEVDIRDWKDLVKSIPPFCLRCLRVEISADGERWFDAYEILPRKER
jgi:hypothetical protein